MHPDKKQNVPAGKVASEFTAKALQGKAVELEKGAEEKDDHGRLLRYVYVDGKNFCVELVRAGHSPYYTPYGHGQHRDAFETAEKEARDASRGIWADPELAEKYQRLKSKWGADGKKADAKAAAQPSAPKPAANTPAPTVRDVVSAFYASAKSKVYHLPACAHCQRIEPDNLMKFVTREEAAASGRRPCKECNP